MDPGQVARMQQAAESRMVDRCTICAASSRGQMDEATASYPTTAGAVSYTGPCLVKFGTTQPHDVDSAGQARILQQVEVHLPVAATLAVEPGEVITVDASTGDPALVGRHFRITGQFHQTYAASRRFPVEEVS